MLQLRSHRTPTPYYTGCYTTLTLAIFPLSIYFLQMLGKVSTIAAGAAGILVVLKVIIDWSYHRRQRSHQYDPSSQIAFVRVQAPLAGCYFCKNMRPLRPYEVAGHRVGICQHCHDCVGFTSRHA